MRPINLERLDLSSDTDLEAAYAAALALAHDAPRELAGDPPVINGSMTWAARSREAFRIGNEIERRRRAAGSTSSHPRGEADPGREAGLHSGSPMTHTDDE